MDDAVGNENVGDNDLGVVNENAVVVDGDGDVGAVDGGDGGAVCEARRVSDCTGNHVVSKDLGEVVGGEAGEGRTNVLEGLIGGCEDGYVGGGVHGFDQVGGNESTAD